MAESIEGTPQANQVIDRDPSTHIPGMPPKTSIEIGEIATGPKRMEQAIVRGVTAVDIAKDARGEQEIGYDALPEKVKVGLSEDDFSKLIAESIAHGVVDAERLTEYHKGLRPQPESEGFKEEIDNPHFRLDEETGINYAVYNLNKDKVGKPLVVKLLWSAGANSRTSRGFLSALSSKVDQPIVIIDSAATGKTSVPYKEWMKYADFNIMAESEKRVLDEELKEKGFDKSKIDILGLSLGGIQAAKLAELYGDRVDRLLTFSTPGFVKKNPISFATGFVVTEAAADQKIVEEEDLGIKENRAFYDELFGKLGVKLDAAQLSGLFKILPHALRAVRPLMGDLTDLLPSEQISSERIPALFRYYYLMTRAPLGEIYEDLAPETSWIDLVGSKDAITDYSDHLAAVRKRNNIFPKRKISFGRTRGYQKYEKFRHTSSVHILGSDPHSWFAITTEVAEKAAQLLSGQVKAVKA